MIKKEELQRKIDKMKRFAKEMEKDAKEENNQAVSLGFMGMSKAYKHAVEMLENLMESE